MPRLYVLSGPEIGRTHDAAEGAVLGRAAECDVPVRGGSVSRRHARLERDGPRWVVADLGSRNGIHKDGKRAERIPVGDGDVFLLGEVELRFRVEVDELSEAPPPPAPAPAPTKVAPREEFGDEIDLDDEPDEDDIELEFAPGGGVGAVEPAPAPKPVAAPRSTPAPTPAGEKAPRRARPSVAERAAAAGVAVPGSQRSGGGGVELRDPGRPALQFQRQEARRGFLVSDLAQQPAWVKLLVAALLLALFGGIFWVAFRGTAALKGGQGAPVEVGEPGE